MCLFVDHTNAPASAAVLTREATPILISVTHDLLRAMSSIFSIRPKSVKVGFSIGCNTSERLPSAQIIAPGSASSRASGFAIRPLLALYFGIAKCFAQSM
jgi:hypothetical protein